MTVSRHCARQGRVFGRGRTCAASARDLPSLVERVSCAKRRGAVLRFGRVEGAGMAVDRGRRGGIGGISVGGIQVIVGIVVAIIWSLWLGIIIALIGLIAFG